MMRAFTFLLVAASVADASHFKEGDTCGVTSRDFLNYDYRSDYLVAGETGCDLGGDSRGCYCAPDLEDGESLSEWKWQCNNSVKFGPTSSDKFCPDVIPVAKGLGDLDVILNRRLQDGQQSVQCDTAIHPTGRPGDEVCPYSDCDEGGEHSAICACIDLEQYGMGEGMEWVCMHASCSCGDDKDGHDEDLSSATSPSTFISAILLVVMVAFN